MPQISKRYKDMKIGSAEKLYRDVVKERLCALCGACSGHCPYLVSHKGKQVLLHNCTLSEGQCYQYCPRTYMDMDALSEQVFGVPYDGTEFGIVKDLFLARATDKEIRTKGQDGGTITALLSLALEEQLIDCAVCSKMSVDKTPNGSLARSKEDLLQCAGSCYSPSPVLETYNRISKENNENLGIVGLPCQVQAFTKMRLYAPQNRRNINNVKLVMGIFCGWALSYFEFNQFLGGKCDLAEVVKFDIPHHPERTFDMYTNTGKISIELDEIRRFIMPTCSYCMDMTAEFADISVGSGRRAYLGWNTVLVRTEAGTELIERAKAKRTIEIQPLPAENLNKLKLAALNKKKLALKNIGRKTGNKKDLLYLSLSKTIRDRLQP
jgi:coenzyme F420 hydrogenase subunit beta